MIFEMHSSALTFGTVSHTSFRAWPLQDHSVKMAMRIYFGIQWHAIASAVLCLEDWVVLYGMCNVSDPATQQPHWPCNSKLPSTVH
jgi:hypothetical protein